MLSHLGLVIIDLRHIRAGQEATRMMRPEPWRHEFMRVNSIRVHYVTMGKGPLIVLLHGFPEFWYSWRHQIPALATHFRVVAMDMRGYNESEKPSSLEEYTVGKLVGDVIGVVRGLGEQQAVIVGHDWGGVVAWRVAMMFPELVKRLIILNAPHPAARHTRGFHDLGQMRRSWYMFFFLLPEIPEQVLSRNNFEILRSFAFGTAVRRGAFSESDIEAYVASWRKPGGLTGGINYYRANVSASYWLSLGRLPELPKIRTPTLQIWGEEDPYLGKELTEGTAEFVDATYRLHFIPNCGHWVQQEAPQEVNQNMLDFLKESR